MRPVGIETEGPPVLNDRQPGLITPVEHLVGDPAAGVAEHQGQGMAAMPLHTDDGGGATLCETLNHRAWLQLLECHV